jgi:hypothetical protein
MESKTMAKSLRMSPGLAMCLMARDSTAKAMALVAVAVGSMYENWALMVAATMTKRGLMLIDWASSARSGTNTDTVAAFAVNSVTMHTGTAMAGVIAQYGVDATNASFDDRISESPLSLIPSANAKPVVL